MDTPKPQTAVQPADQHHLLTANTLVTTPSAVGPCVVLKMSTAPTALPGTYTDGRLATLGLSTAAWNYTGGTQSIAAGSSGYYQTETDFNQDFNGDGTIGSPLDYVEQIGNTYLLKDSSTNGYAQASSGGQSISITASGQQVGDGTYSGWTMRGAENVNGTNSVAWTHTNGDLYTWTLNSSWAQTGGMGHSAGSSGYYQTETDFNQDFNGDGTIGSPLDYVEQIGNTYLLKDSSTNGYAQASSGGQSISITASGQQVGDGTYSGWTMRGAENVNGTNSVAWTHTNGDLYTWTLNSSWAQTGGMGHSAGSSGYYQTETDFNQDFNGDGTIGSPLDYVEQIGNTYLLKDSSTNGYAQASSGGQSISITASGQQVGDGTYSGWTMRGAENVNGTNSVAWTHTNGDLYTWTLNSSWAQTGGMGHSAGSSGYYQTETDFNQDFNGDGTIGSPLDYVEQIGNTYLLKDSSTNGYAQASSGGQSISITASGQQVGDGTYSGWTMRGAENVNGTNSVAWTHTNGDLYTWTLNSSWAQTGGMGHSAGSSGYYQTETDFNQDFNGDGTIGSPLDYVEQIGNTYLLKDSSTNGYAQASSGGQSISITASGQQVGDGTYSGWTMRGAENVNGTNSVAWTHTNGDLYTWTLNSSWAQTGGMGHSAGSSGYYQTETDFNQDFNGDGTIGDPCTNW